jgi:hypothetical protein
LITVADRDAQDFEHGDGGVCLHAPVSSIGIAAQHLARGDGVQRDQVWSRVHQSEQGTSFSSNGVEEMDPEKATSPSTLHEIDPSRLF